MHDDGDVARHGDSFTLTHPRLTIRSAQTLDALCLVQRCNNQAAAAKNAGRTMIAEAGRFVRRASFPDSARGVIPKCAPTVLERLNGGGSPTPVRHFKSATTDARYA